MQRTPRDINTPVPAFGRAGADLTCPIDSPYFFLMAGTQYRAGRPSERRNTTESETVTGSNARRPSLLYPGNGHTYFLLSVMTAGKVSEFIFSLPVRQSLGRYVRCSSTVEQPLSKGCYIDDTSCVDATASHQC